MSYPFAPRRVHRAAGLVTTPEQKRHIYRVDTATAVGVYGGFAPAGTPGHFSAGDPTVGQRGTIPGPDWFEDKQEELLNLAIAGGIAAQKGNTKQLWQAILAMATLTDTGTVNHVVIASPVAFDAINPGTVLTVFPANTNTGATDVNIGVGGAITLVRPDATALQPGDVILGRPFQMVAHAGQWVLLNLPRGRQRLVGNISYSVNAATGSDANDGITAPWLTIQKAANVIQQMLDLAGQDTVTVNCTGAFTQGATISGAFQGAAGPSAVNFNFQAGATLTVTNGAGFHALDGAQFTVTLPGSASLAASGVSGPQGYGLLAEGPGAVIVSAVANFGACGQAHIGAQYGGTVRSGINYSISGSASFHWFATAGGTINVSNVTITLSGSPVFTSGFAGAGTGGVLTAQGDTFTGSAGATTPRYTIAGNSNIYTNGAGATYFPGTTGGTDASGHGYN